MGRAGAFDILPVRLQTVAQTGGATRRLFGLTGPEDDGGYPGYRQDQTVRTSLMMQGLVDDNFIKSQVSRGS
jgi:hypothetical protein